MAKPDLGKLVDLSLVTRTNEEMAEALPACWRALRTAGYRRRTLIVAFTRAWWAGKIAVDPKWKPTLSSEPTVSVIFSQPKR